MKKIKIISILFIFLLPFVCFAEDDIIADTIAENAENIEVIEEKPLLKVKDVKEINKTNTITLEALNKITAKSYRYDVKIGDSIIFERLKITPLFCWRSSPDQVLENKALLRITETLVDGNKKKIFYGWMFSSSPSASSMEHPMYDVRVVDCFMKEYDNN